MGNFSVSSDLFSDYDDLYFQDLKKKKAEDILKRKEAAIQSLTSGVSDADNSVLNGINTRQGAPNVTLDTGETPKGFTLPYAEGREGVRDKHARTLASELGYHPSQITDEMLYQKGLESQAYSEELKLEGQPDPENPQLQVTEHGKDKYGRPITEVVNPYTGVNINRALNTSEHNLDFYSKYNKYDQANYAEKGDDKLPNFVIDQNEDGTYNFHVRGGLKNPNIEDPERERTVIRRTVPTDIFGFHDEERKEGGRYDTFSRNNLSENDLAHWVNAFKGVSQLDTESAGGKFKFSGHVPEEVLMEEQDFLEGAQRIALSGYEEVYRLLKKAGKLSVKEVLNYVTLSPLENSLEIESPLAKDIPKELTLAQAFELMPDSAALIEKAKLADTYAKEALTLLTTPEEKFRAAKSAELDLIEFVEDRHGHDFRYSMSSEKISKELGWKPRINFEKGMEDTIKWYLDNEDYWKDVPPGIFNPTPWK